MALLVGAMLFYRPTNLIVRFLSINLFGFIFVTYICEKDSICPSYLDHLDSFLCSSPASMSLFMSTCGGITEMQSSIGMAKVL